MSRGKNIFSLYEAQGKMIKKAHIENRPEEDDDWVILEFAAGDPAVSDFSVPKSYKPTKIAPKRNF